jgi:hypothetical protein
MQIVSIVRLLQQQNTDFGEGAQIDETTFKRLAKPSVMNQ